MVLGNVGRASSEDFQGKRKVLLIPYVTATRNDAELHALITQYWEEALAQVRKLESSLGTVKHLFHEGSVGDGPEAREVLEQGNAPGYPYLKQLIDDGAAIQPTEGVEVLKETLDLHRCLSVVQASHAVLDRLLEWFEDCRKRRYEEIAANIYQHMAPDDAGVLVIAPDHQVQFEQDVQVIYVAPPALDRINRWLREHPIDAPAPGPPPESERAEVEQDDTPGWARS